MTEGSRQLSTVPLFDGLDEAHRARLEAASHYRKAAEGEEVLSKDEIGSDVFFVLEGAVRIVNYSPNGREVAYAQAQAGEYFGELSAIDGRPRSATVLALDDCVLGQLNGSVFRDLVRSNAEIGFRVMQKLTAIVRTADERIMDLATLSAYQRVYNEVLRLVRADPVRKGSWLVYPLPTQSQIAGQASTTRETVARVLSQLQADEIVERKSRTLYIRDMERLRDLAARPAAPAKEA